MGKRVFMFPGQGSQYIGMGKEFYEAIPEARAVYDLAGDVTGLDVAALCFEENERINITEYTQICMLVTEMAILAALKTKGIKADAAAGLSLGEYGALIASGAMTMADAFAVVRKRGIYMQEAVPAGGAMSAILGMDANLIADLCEKIEAQGPDARQEESMADSNLPYVVSVANYNCPGQIVITGRSDAVAEAGEKCKEAGAKRVVPLNVSGPFHSRLQAGAAERLARELEGVEIHDMELPYITNVTADYVKSKEEVRDYLVKQITSPVRWQQTIERLLADGADEFVEIGPGRSLSGFMKKINREVSTVNIDKMEDFLNYVDR